MIKGIKRFRQAIKNQQDLGNGDLRLAYHDAEEIAAEIEGELAQLAWAKGVPAPVDADGEVVPLTTKAMYDEDGREVQVNHFRLTGHNVGDRLKWRVREMSGAVLDLDHLHLARPDSWEKLEEDVKRFGDDGTACEYFCNELRICDGCRSPSHIGFNCRNGVARDVLRRAEALAERDAKGAEQ